MSDYKIEKKVPIPEYRTKRAKWPFREMKVGDSFELPDHEVKNARSSAYQLALRTNMKFIIRKMQDGTFRCWRIE